MMRTKQFIAAAFRALVANKVRSILTMIGIVIGIAAIVIIFAVGNGAQSLLLSQISDLGGSNLVGILPGAAEDTGAPASAMGISVTTLVSSDAEAIREDIHGIDGVAGYVRGVATIASETASVDTSFSGVSPDFEAVEDIEMLQGSFFTADDDRSLSQVAVLGYQTYQDLFGSGNAVGARIRIKRQSYRVVGVITERGTQFFQNQDNQVFVPLLTAQKRLLGIDHLSFIRVRATDGEDVDAVMENIRALLRDRHDLSGDEQSDFSVRSTEQALDILGTITDVLRYFLAAVSAISLLVGGIGIMNIMLVSVLERTREIGLRKAVGARPGDLRLQFLAETIIIAVLGGLVGLILGIIVAYGIAVVVRLLGYSWAFKLGYEAYTLSIVFPLATGIVFGFYPAQKAAGLKPVEALHYE